MWVVPALCFVFALLLSIWGIQFYINLFRNPFYFAVPLGLAIFLPISIIFLLPIDYVQSNADSAPYFAVAENAVLYLWKSNYWTTFLLTWLILPLLQEFFRSGQFRDYHKLVDAFKRNLRFQLIVLGVSLVGVVYMLLEVGLTVGHLRAMVIALAHIYALIIALWLMAHGMISIPRNKWIAGSLMSELNHHYLKVPKLLDDLEDCKISFKEDILQVVILTKNFTDSNEDFVYRDWILQLYNQSPEDLRDLMEMQYNQNDHSNIERSQLDNKFMVKLTSSFNANNSKLVAYESEFNNLLDQIITLEDLTNNTSDNPQFRVTKVKYFLSPKYRYLYYYYVHPIVNRFVSIILFASSFIIVQSEFFHSTKLSLLNVVIYNTGIHNHSTLQFIVSCTALSYMLVCALNSLTKLKIFNMYHLVPHKSDRVSACFYATYTARLTIPLSYNFITLFVSRKAVFEHWFGESIHLSGLFNLMNNWLPRFVLIPVVLTAFNVYDKLKKKLGFSSDLYDNWGLFDDDGETPGDVENINNKRKDLIIVEAKRIVNREFSRRNTADLRPFNLAAAADTNYENNRQSFHNSLLDGSNRIDNYYDNPADAIVPPSTTLWNRIGTTFSSLREAVQSRLSSEQPHYADEPLDEFHYDDDANTVI